MLRIILLFLIFTITTIGTAQDSTYYTCVNCSNGLFVQSEIIKEKKQVYIVNFNKTDNPFRIDNKKKDVHCVHCDNHTGYEEEDGTIKVVHTAVHKNGNSYDCNTCKKPLFDEKDLKENSQNAYIFNRVNNTDVAIANRSYILHEKKLYCSFCYDSIGKSQKKNKLKIFKKNIKKPQS
ncbi:MAG: hypothetical protein CVT95_00975 [Bacteroidetes bacterium HGW-Bacteroidetes-12]|nr:MAG: hypothetical protein CVT95_00975 [Bacteroidetes bacterium HGW-Bacteroidetes-12]